jgi:hypothetical protein
MAEIVSALPDDIVMPALTYPGIDALIHSGPIEDKALAATLSARMSSALAGGAAEAAPSMG